MSNCLVISLAPSSSLQFSLPLPLTSLPPQSSLFTLQHIHFQSTPWTQQTPAYRPRPPRRHPTSLRASKHSPSLPGQRRLRRSSRRWTGKTPKLEPATSSGSVIAGLVTGKEEESAEAVSWLRWSMSGFLSESQALPSAQATARRAQKRFGLVHPAMARVEGRGHKGGALSRHNSVYPARSASSSCPVHHAAPGQVVYTSEHITRNGIAHGFLYLVTLGPEISAFA